jgi:hypothetical protein
MLALALLLAQMPATVTSPPEPLEGHFCFAETLCAAGDQNGDGVPDFALGETSEKGLDCWILSAKDASVLRTVHRTWTSPSWGRLATGPDANRDGKPEIIAYSWSFRPNGTTDIMLVSGVTGEDLWRVSIPHLGFGAFARIVHDIDGDGVDDVGLLVPERDSARLSLLTLSGRTGACIDTLTIEDTSRSFRAGGNQSRVLECPGECGFAELPDIDGDGANDIAILKDGGQNIAASCSAWSRKRKTQLWSVQSREPHAGTTGTIAQIGGADGVDEIALTFLDRVDVVSSKTGDLRYRFERPAKGDTWTRFGQQVCDLGDLDGDGVKDCVVSEPDDFWGGVLHACSGRDGHLIWTKATPFALDLRRLGNSLAALRDVDGDGVDDFVAGTSGTDTAAPGCAVLFSGKSGRPLIEIRHGRNGVEARKPDPNVEWSSYR